MNKISIQDIQEWFSKRDDVLFAFLFGSKVVSLEEGRDWDFAICWKQPSRKSWDGFGVIEKMRHDLVTFIGVSTDQVDVVDISTARLPIKTSIVEQGIPVAGMNEFAIFEFYQGVWSMQEEFHRRMAHGL